MTSSYDLPAMQELIRNHMETSRQLASVAGELARIDGGKPDARATALALACQLAPKPFDYCPAYVRVPNTAHDDVMACLKLAEMLREAGIMLSKVRLVLSKDTVECESMQIFAHTCPAVTLVSWLADTTDVEGASFERTF